MEKYYIEFKRSYKKDWIDMSVQFSSYESVKKAIDNLLLDDFRSKDYDYEYRIMKDNKQIGDIYILRK